MRMTHALTVAGAAVILAGYTWGLTAQVTPGAASTVQFPDESAGLNAIARALVSVYDHADVVALGEWHGQIALDADRRLALVRLPEFAKRVRSVVAACASVTERPTLDRYVRGKNEPRAQLERVWKAIEETS